MGNQLKYVMDEACIGSPQPVEITADEFAALQRAKQFFLLMVSIEEKWDLLLENYIEYERELLDLALNQMVFNHTSLTAFRSDRSRVTRRVVNLLTTFRLYVEQVEKDLATYYSSTSQEHSTLTARVAAEKKGTRAYRVLREIRNHAQHNGLPVHTLIHDAAWTEESTYRELVFRTRVRLDVTKLLEDKELKKIRRDLASFGQHIDLTLLIREAMEATGRIHEAVRSITARDTAVAQKTISDAQSRFKKSKSGQMTVFGIYALDESQNEVESEVITTNLIEHQHFLATKNRDLVNLSSRAVSSAPRRTGRAKGA